MSIIETKIGCFNCDGKKFVEQHDYSLDKDIIFCCNCSTAQNNTFNSLLLKEIASLKESISSHRQVFLERTMRKADFFFTKSSEEYATVEHLEGNVFAIVNPPGKEVSLSTTGERENMSILEKAIIESLTPRIAESIDASQIKNMREFLIGILKDTKYEIEISLKDFKNKKITVKNPHFQLEDVLKQLQTQEPIFLTGAAGSGKSTIAQQCADILKLSFGAISICAQTTKSDFLGYYDATGRYIGTSFRKIYEEGGLFLIDEIDAGNPNVLAVLNSCLSNTFFSFPDGLIKKHEDFFIIATANTYGNGSLEYVGRNQLDNATLDRFNFIEINYDENLEIALTPKKYLEQVKKIHTLREVVKKQSIRIIISTRAIIKIVKLLEIGMDFAKCLHHTIFKGCEKEISNRLLGLI